MFVFDHLGKTKDDIWNHIRTRRNLNKILSKSPFNCYLFALTCQLDRISFSHAKSDVSLLVSSWSQQGQDRVLKISQKNISLQTAKNIICLNSDTPVKFRLDFFVYSIVQLHNDVVGCFVRSKLKIGYTISAELGDALETARFNVFSKLFKK